MKARTTTANTAMAVGVATGTATARTMMTTCGQQICGESASCMAGHLAEVGGVEDEARNVSIPHLHHLHAARILFICVRQSASVSSLDSQIQCALVHWLKG